MAPISSAYRAQSRPHHVSWSEPKHVCQQGTGLPRNYGGKARCNNYFAQSISLNCSLNKVLMARVLHPFRPQGSISWIRKWAYFQHHDEAFWLSHWFYLMHMFMWYHLNVGPQTFVRELVLDLPKVFILSMADFVRNIICWNSTEPRKSVYMILFFAHI